MERTCLVTVGATVGFEDLTRSVLHPDFWAYLDSQGFTELRIQCGPDIPWASKLLSSREDELPSNLKVSVFEMSKNLMKEEMVRCKPIKGQREQGLIVSHAGTGTILDAWKFAVPLVVVPNTRLLHDHQTELARYLSVEGYAIMSSTSVAHLQEAIRKAVGLMEENMSRWPPNKIEQHGTSSTVSIWDINPAEVQKEENAQMAHD